MSHCTIYNLVNGILNRIPFLAYISLQHNIIAMENYILKENILADKEKEKEKNIIIMVIYYLKENIYMDLNGMEKDIILMEI